MEFIINEKAKSHLNTVIYILYIITMKKMQGLVGFDFDHFHKMGTKFLIFGLEIVYILFYLYQFL